MISGEPWPDYLRKLATEAFVGVPDAADNDRKYILSDVTPAASITDPIVAITGAAMSRTDLPGFGVDLAAAASTINDLAQAGDLRVARLRIEALEAELDLARQTIALLSQRPSNQAYDALQQERDALRAQLLVAVAPAPSGFPARALRYSRA